MTARSLLCPPFARWASTPHVNITNMRNAVNPVFTNDMRRISRRSSNFCIIVLVQRRIIQSSYFLHGIRSLPTWKKTFWRVKNQSTFKVSLNPFFWDILYVHEVTGVESLCWNNQLLPTRDAVMKLQKLIITKASHAQTFFASHTFTDVSRGKNNQNQKVYVPGFYS